MSKKIWQVTVTRKSERLRTVNSRYFKYKKDAEEFRDNCEDVATAGLEVWTSLEQINETRLDCTTARLAAA